MPEDPSDEAESAWLLEPPSSGEMHVSIEIGSEVELSPEALEALEAFMSSLQESEVSGFMFDLGQSDACGAPRYFCRLDKCLPYSVSPTCAQYIRCRIAP